MSTPRSVLLAACLAAATIAAGCGEKSEEIGNVQAEPFDLALDFYVNPDHAGIYTALDRGYFTDAGLDVHPRVPSDPAAPIKQVAAGQVDLAISYEPEVLLARDQGLDVVAVASMVNEPLTSLIWLGDSGVQGVADLAGRTVATAGIPYQDAFMDAIAEHAGISPAQITKVDVGFNLLPAVLSGRADAMLGGFRNIEGVDLEARGTHPSVIPVNQIGIPNYDELVLVASDQMVQDDPEDIRLFIAALARGTDAAAADPETATQTIVDAGTGRDPQLTRDETEATLPLLVPNRKGPYGLMSPGEWVQFGGFMYDQGLLGQRPVIAKTLTNDLLPRPPG
jgi:putative hydroxymethylpyrimidine transport system substrate-binding protein